jgi:hypothetical protein
MNTQTTTTANPQDMEDVYNALMWNIEPELTTEFMDDLEFLYANETDEERELRGAWYAIAFDTFYTQYDEFVSKCTNHLEGVKKKVMKIKESDASERDTSNISSIEDSIEHS